MAYIADGGWWGWMGVDGGKYFNREVIEKTEIALMATFAVGLG